MKTIQNNAAILAARKTIANLLGTGSRKEKVEFGKTIDASVLEAAVPLLEKGIDAKWLCADGTVPAVDSLVAVGLLLEQNTDIVVTELQAKFSRQQVLEGLSVEQIEGLKPSVEVAETEPVKIAETPKVEAKTYACSFTTAKSKRRYPATELLVPNDSIIRSMLKLADNALLTPEQIASTARLPMFVSDAQARNYFWLNLSLEHNAREQQYAQNQAVIKTKQAAEEVLKQAGLEEYFSFCRTVGIGEVKNWKGKARTKCVVCKHVHLAAETRYPPLSLIQYETPRRDKDGEILKDRNGNDKLQTPTVEAVQRRFTTCPTCQRMEDRVLASEWMDTELMTTVVTQQLATEKAEMEAAQKEWDKRSKARPVQGTRGTGHFDMDSHDLRVGRLELSHGTYVDDGSPKQVRRDKRSRNDENRRNQGQVASEADDSSSSADLATEMAQN